MLPLKDAKAYRFRYRFGKELKVGFVVAERIRDARDFVRKLSTHKGLRLIGRLRYYKKIKVVADKHTRIEPAQVSRSYIDNV